MNNDAAACCELGPSPSVSCESTLAEPEIAADISPVPGADRRLMLSEHKAALITGAGGLLGRSVAARLGHAGWKVIGVTHRELDITNEEAVNQTIESVRPDILINCAATADVDRCQIEPDWAYAVNTTGPSILARACRRFGSEIVHISTDYVFDGTKEGFYTQEDEPRPLSVYGESKLAGEIAVREGAPQSYVLRTSWLFGCGGKNFGSRVIDYARSGAPLKGVTDQISIPSYAPDVSERIEQIVALGVHGLYHVTSSGPTTWFEFARRALDLAGLGDVEIEPVTRAALNQRAPRPHNSAMRCLLSERLGLEPLRHWRDALVDFVSES